MSPAHLMCKAIYNPPHVSKTCLLLKTCNFLVLKLNFHHITIFLQIKLISAPCAGPTASSFPAVVRQSFSPPTQTLPPFLTLLSSFQHP